ncbi:MAG TPA: basic amino acid ABC transporter substrate-binding protein [Acidimicrobiales bacterium]|nr:basic amino acid ABC transporter substrate-binding protein [Acidimicrobiales bacterium]
MSSSLRRILALLMASALMFAACGDSDSDASTDDGSGDPEPSGEVELVSAGTLSVCSDTPYEPFEFEGDDGEQTGYDIDLLRAIADENSLDLEVIDLPFDGILGSLAAGDCDVVASALSITDERKQQVDFSGPYFDADQSLLIRSDDEGTITALDDVTGTIGVQSGTTGADYAEENAPEGAEVKSFEDADGLFGALTSGDIDAILQDFPVNAFRATQDDSFVVTEKFPTPEQYGFAVKKDNPTVLALVDDGLETIRANGTFDTIFQTYFGA